MVAANLFRVPTTPSQALFHGKLVTIVKSTEEFIESLLEKLLLLIRH
jgi:hypothetical protein